MPKSVMGAKGKGARIDPYAFNANVNPSTPVTSNTGMASRNNVGMRSTKRNNKSHGSHK